MPDFDPQSKISQSNTTDTGTSLPPSKPLAAYVLAYNSFMVRQSQCLFWLWRGELDTADCVPRALKELREAVAVLSDEAPEDLSRKMTSVCKDFATITRRQPFVPKNCTCDLGYWFNAEKSKGHQKWRDLVSLAQSALPEKSPWKRWFQLGAAIADYDIKLFIWPDHSDPHGMPPLEPVLDCAVELSEHGYEAIREVYRLSQTRNRPWRPQIMILAEVVETPDCDLDYELSLPETYRLLTKQMMDLNFRIRHSLSEMQSAPPVGKQNGEDVPPAETILILTDRQEKILEALNGQAMKKQQLAAEVCAGEGSRLYKKGGIKELMKANLVFNKPGVGYYRPDAPPSTAVIVRRDQPEPTIDQKHP